MAVTLQRNLTARRNAPKAWEWTDIVDDDGAPVDFTAAEDVRMQVRLYGAQPGDALITLAPVVADLTEGLVLGVGSIAGYIEEASLAILPEKAPGDPVVFKFDVLVELTGVVPEVWIEGDLTVEYGVTSRLDIITTEGGEPLLTEDGYVLIGE